MTRTPSVPTGPAGQAASGAPSAHVTPGSPGADTGTDAVAPASEGRAKWWILGVLSLAQLLISLDSTVVTVALPSAQADLGFSVEDRQWVVTAYALGFGALLLVGGRLGDVFGRQRVFLAGLVGFALASALGGAAQNYETLITARALQGVFSAVLAPAALSLLSTTFQLPGERARAFGVFGGISAGGGAVGLLLGGAMTEFMSWRWSLYVNIPLVVLAVAGTVALLDLRRREATGMRIDLPGAALAVSGLFSVVYGMANAERSGWGSASTIAWISAGTALLAVFAVLESRVRSPLLPLRVLADRTRAGALLSIGVSGVGLFVTFFFMTFYMSGTLAYGPLAIGTAFLPFIGALIIASGISAALARQVATRTLVLVGTLLAAAGMWLFALVAVDGSYVSDVLPGMLVAGVGVGLFIAPAMGAATSGVEDDDAGVLSALVHVAQQIGGSMGVAALSAVAATAAAAVDGYQAAFLWAAVIYLVGGVLSSLMIRPGVIESSPVAA